MKAKVHTSATAEGSNRERFSRGRKEDQTLGARGDREFKLHYSGALKFDRKLREKRLKSYSEKGD